MEIHSHRNDEHIIDTTMDVDSGMRSTAGTRFGGGGYNITGPEANHGPCFLFEGIWRYAGFLKRSLVK